MHLKKNSYLGFTLMEIIIAVIALAVIASLAYSNYKKSIETSYCYNAKQNLQRIHAASQVYMLKHKGIPTTAGGLASINSSLGIEIIDPNVNYTWTGLYILSPTTASATRSSDYPCNCTILLDMDISATNPGCIALPIF